MCLHIDDKYRISIFLDTNVLVDILDDTFENLSHSINFLVSSDFVTLKSSHYVIYELVEVRKREHFLREVVKKRINDNISISKLVGKKGIWKFDNVKYEDHKADIQLKVLSEKERITNDFMIEWENNIFHEGLLKPTLDLCLESTISREDSLVLLSCAYPSKSKKEKQIILMTRDKFFSDGYNEADIVSVFDEYGLTVPQMVKTGSVECKIKYENIPQKIDHYNGLSGENNIQQFWVHKLKELIIEKNANTFLGYTYAHAGEKCVFFELQKGMALNKDIALTIIGRNLDFVCSTNVISEFWNYKEIEKYPLVDVDNNISISFIPYDKNENGTIEFQDKALLSKIKEKGNLVFLNEDA